MKDSFIINERMYEKYYYSAKEIATEVLPSLYGTTIEDLTYGELALITKMYNHGWTLLPTYVFEFKDDSKKDDGKKIVPFYRWFGLFCDEDTNVHQYTCFLYKDGGVELFDRHKQICKFTTIDNMFLYMKQLDDTEPLKFSRYYNEKVVKNLKSFDIYGIDNEIYTEDAKVFPNGIDMLDLTFELDITKCDIQLVFEVPN
jgi:hypothetical protein